MQPGEDPFLVWNVPENRIHSVNCMAVSTAPGSEGQWEFIEYICKYTHCIHSTRVQGTVGIHRVHL